MIKITKWLEQNRITAFFLNRDYFALIYTTICILWFFPLLGWLIDPLCKVCFIWGAFLILWDFMTKRRMFRSIYWLLPLLIIVSFGITILLNVQYSFYMGIKHMVYLGISLILLYGQDRKRSYESIKKLLYRLNQIIIVIILIASLVSIIMFIFQVSFSFYSGDTLLRQGFLENRLFGVYTSPNTGALFVVISISAMLINSTIKYNGKIKLCPLYVINLIVQTIYLSLTLSKGGALTLTAFLAVFSVVWIFPKLLSKYSAKKAVPAAILAAAALIFCCNVVIIPAVRYGMSYIPSIVNMLGQSKPTDDPSQQDPDDPELPNHNIQKVEMERIESGDDASNGRFTIWFGSLKALAQHPLFGYANMWLSKGDATKFDPSLLSEAEQTWLYKHNGNLHNAYVQVAVYSGVVGLILFVALGVLLFQKVGRVLICGKKETTQYQLLALLFSIIVAIAANGLVEAHLLYTRQDPYGAIFWIYVGLAAVLAERIRYGADAAESGDTIPETFAFAADTPFQTMNCVNFVLHSTDASAGCSDLFIYHQFRHSHEISERIKQSGVFNNVYDIEPYKKYPSLIQKFVTIYRLFLPQKAIQAACSQKLRLSQKKYQKLCISFPTPFTLGLHMAFPHADVYHIEDGLGSYGGNITTDYSSKLFHFINQFMYCGELDLHPVACYLSAPAFSKNTMEGENRELPCLKPGPELDTMQNIFDYHANHIYQNKAVYLTQPLDDRSIYRPEQEKRLIEIVKEKLAGRVIVRIHPRQTEEDFAGIEKDTYGNLWELECVNQITDQNILISAFSTAQFMPKIMKDAEPTIIFTYRLLFSSLDDPFLKDFAKLIDDFRGLYRNPDKIYVPATFEELETILSQISVQ